MIKEYFANYFLHMSDVTFDMQTTAWRSTRSAPSRGRVTLVDTGDRLDDRRAAEARGRLRAETKRPSASPTATASATSTSARYDRFPSRPRQAGHADRHPPARAFRRAGHRRAIRCAASRKSRKGDGGMINGGFFVLSPKVLDYIEGDDTVWEHEPLKRWPQTASSWPTSTTVSGSRWTPCATRLLLKNCGPVGQGAVEDLGHEHVRRSLLARQARSSDRPHRLQGQLAVSLWLQRLGAEVHGFALAAADRSQRCSTWPASPRAWSRPLATSATSRRCAAAMRRCRAGDRHPHGGAATGAPVLRRTRSRPTPPTSWARCTCWRPRDAPGSVRAVVNVTTDKCYENREWLWGYRENEPMGGHDPYSSSKGCAELVTSAYRSSFLQACGISTWRYGARGQRHRRWRLGGGPAGARHPARASSAASRVASATRTRSAPGSMCWSRCRAT